MNMNKPIQTDYSAFGKRSNLTVMEGGQAFPADIFVDPNAGWRVGMQREVRRRNADSILDLLTRNLLSPCAHDANELRRIATAFEEKIFKAATNQIDYSRRVSAKLHSIEMKTNGQINPTIIMDPGCTELEPSELYGAPTDSEDSSMASS